jgi:hypothetical protein
MGRLDISVEPHGQCGLTPLDDVVSAYRARPQGWFPR